MPRGRGSTKIITPYLLAVNIDFPFFNVFNAGQVLPFLFFILFYFILLLLKVFKIYLTDPFSLLYNPILIFNINSCA